MDFLGKYLFSVYSSGSTIQNDRKKPPSSNKRSNSYTLNFTVIILIILLVFEVAAQTPDFIWDTDENTELNILQCVLQIHRDNTAGAVKIFENLNDYSNYYLIYMITKRSYDNNVENLHKLVNFIIKLPWCNHQYAGFSYLFDELKLNNQLFNFESMQFAYRLKKFLDGNQTCLHENDDMKLLDKLKKLKENFPETTQLIVWQNSKLCLKNLKFDEHLYVAGCCDYDKERRRIFTWIPKGEIGPQGEFSFEPVDDIASVFRIKSNNFQEYMYAAECCTYDKDRRNVFTWIPKSDIGPHGEWVLELNSGSNSFRIRNNYFNEYLYAAECCPYDEERRNVFTWIAKGDVGVHGDWQIMSC